MRFDKSKELFERSRRSLAGGISSQHRAHELPVPLFFEKGKGSRLWDVDGNEFIDYFMGNGATVMGHAPDLVLDAVNQQVSNGQVYAGQHRLEIEVAELLTEVIPCAELVRWNSSGSEVVLAAIRVARAHTGRNKFIKFEGHYHGWDDSVLYSLGRSIEELGPRENPTPAPASAGMASGTQDEVITLPWNDLYLLTEIVRRQADEIAAIIMEPIACNTNGSMPKEGYLEGVRKLCDETGIVLIFDEVITGFRVAPGGAQELLGVTPDVATFAKGVSGGFPMAVVAGKREIMQHFADGSAMHAGTASGNTTSLAATKAAVSRLSDNDGEALKKASEIGNRLIEGLRNLAKTHEEDVLIQGVGTVFNMIFTDQPELPDLRSTIKHADTERYERFAKGMMERGVRLPGRGTWLLSTTHTEEDVEETLAAADATFSSM